MANGDEKMTEELKTQMRENFREWAAKMRAGYANLGEFVVEFSQLEFTIRAALGGAVNLPADLINIVPSLYDFTSLCKVRQLVMMHQEPERAKDIEAIFNAYMKVNSERVRVAHGLWSFGFETLAAVHVSRNALKIETYSAEPGQLRDLTRRTLREATPNEPLRMMQAQVLAGCCKHDCEMAAEVVALLAPKRKIYREGEEAVLLTQALREAAG
jgi:hypothetical protein